MSAPTDMFVSVTLAGTATEPPAIELVRYDQFVLMLLKPGSIKEQKYHVGLGIAGEGGEFADAIKRELVYGKPMDRKNIVEELGDLRFYMQAAQTLYGITDQEVLQANADKLAERYVGLKYSDRAALARADKNDPNQSKPT